MLVDDVYKWLNDNSWINDGNNKWRNGRKIRTSDDLVKDYLIDIFVDNTKAQVLTALNDTITISDKDKIDTELLGKLNNKWADAYNALATSRWSAVDDDIWRGLYYTLDASGEKTIVSRVSPASNELRIIGKTDEEVIAALCGLFVNNESTKSLHDYIDEVLTNTIINECSAKPINWTTNITLLANLPASVANVVYTCEPVMTSIGSDRIQLGWALCLPKSLSYYPSVRSYIKCAISAFLAQPNKYIESISDVSNDPNEFTYKYIDLSKYQAGPIEVYENWGKHTFNSVAEWNTWKAWIGSIFIAANNSKQACWLQGGGNMGLSKIQNALYHELGKYTVASFSGPSSLDGSFVNASIVGKRLAIISDVKNENLIRKGVVHNWTGGDISLINQKNKQAFSTKTYLKVLICENIAPRINFEQDNQMSRLLYFKLKIRSNDEKIKMGIGRINESGVYEDVGSATFQADLDRQINAFIFNCIETYHKLCPKDSQIIPYVGMTDRIIAHCADPKSEELYDWVIANIIKDADSEIYYKDLLLAIDIADSSKNDGYFVQSLNLMLEKYFETSVIKRDGLKLYKGITIKARQPTNQSGIEARYNSFDCLEGSK